MTTVLPSAYLGGVHYFARLCAGGCVIDPWEHFIKQSLRSRCRIYAAPGPLTLSVQTVHIPNSEKAAVCDVRIDYSKRWQHAHWTSIVSAYRSTPYFEHYAHRFEPFFTRRFDRLFDLNAQLTELILGIIGSEVTPEYATRYIDPAERIEDLRHSLSEKPRLSRPDPRFTPLPYYQPFAPGFTPGMSVIDLLFAEGPHTLEHLKNCVKSTTFAGE